MTRSISEIANEIARQPFFCNGTRASVSARPYLNAMRSLETLEDRYGMDSARSIVSYFLANAGTWRGDVARRIKAELKTMLKGG